MSHIYNGEFRGNVSEPEIKEVGSGRVQNFTVFAQNQRKNRDTEQYEEVSPNFPIRVALWNENIIDELGKGDLVAVNASVSVETFERRDGSEGIALKTDYVESVEIKISKAAYSGGGAAPRAEEKLGF
jgi:single-stranded DNA-binding protein